MTDRLLSVRHCTLCGRVLFPSQPGPAHKSCQERADQDAADKAAAAAWASTYNEPAESASLLAPQYAPATVLPGRHGGALKADFIRFLSNPCHIKNGAWHPLDAMPLNCQRLDMPGMAAADRKHAADGLMPCAYPGCTTMMIPRKGGKYCRVCGPIAERERRHEYDVRRNAARKALHASVSH
jgi:hypothetical protein